MASPTLIYCGGGNSRFYDIATAAGFKYGSRLPDTIYGPLYFADQDWKQPNRDKYMAGLAEHKPYMASVLDLERVGPDHAGQVGVVDPEPRARGAMLG